MRILVASELDFSIRDGSTTHMQMLVRELAALGHEVHSVFPKPSGDAVVGLAGELHPIDLDIRGEGAIVKGGRLLQYQRRARDAIPGIVRGERIEAAYVREGVATHGLAEGVARARLPVVMEVNGIVSEELEMVGYPSVLSAARDAFSGPALRRAFRIVVVSRRLGLRLASRYGLDKRRLRHVENGVDAEMFRPLDRAASRREFGFPEGVPVAVWTGYMAPWQGLGTLLRAWSRLGGDGILALAGTGPAEAEARRLAARLRLGDSALFLGRVPFERVPTLLSASDIGVAPFTRARNEAIGMSPLKVYEYMSCGLPVAASDLPGLRTLLDGCGVLHEPDSPDALAKALRTLRDAPSRRAGMGSEARRRILAEHTWRRTAERVVGVLEECRGVRRS